MTPHRAQAKVLQEEPLMVPVLRGYQRAEYVACVGLWLMALAFFWHWWLLPSHHVNATGSVLVTLILAWVTILPAYFMAVFFRARKPDGDLRLPAGSRVAMVVTKAPSEPFAIVARTLSAMLTQPVPHDTWLADEDPSPATLEWCRTQGVSVSTRKGREDYHRQTWPRRTRCKEGNLAFFYDHYGYERYDFVVQLDADHVPETDYLYHMLRPFADPAVGYVSAPSICDSNAHESWSARGRLYAEASMHGSLQSGFNGGLAPLCIGSHYAVRTVALQAIGGLGPELAEDHSTTLMMNAHGWCGVHALEAIAHGDGPRTFADLITQEFQWSRSLMMILLQYSPKLVSRLPLRLKIQFLFSQFWYSLFSLFMGLMFFLPVLALVLGWNFVDVSYPDFLVHFIPQSVLLILFAYRWRSTGTFRPVDAKVLSWEMTLFLFARWPWALAGALAAVRDWATGSFVDFRVTPKGTSEVDPLPFRVLAPYGFLALISILPVLFVAHAGETSGFYIFAIVNAAVYVLLLVVIITQHARENTVCVSRRFYRPALAGSLMTLMALPCVAALERGNEGLRSLTWDTSGYILFETRFSVAGAGVGGHELHRIVFNPHWRSGADDN
ncbi:glycosyltransferase family 2 protein [Rhizobium sp. BK602]|uniref:glycosyltransferase family 2 protein n=1 Tax=Rhizobium sp. BK602 TaxID=2586986 RepID=UPI00160C268F|nr:glycosyltransferase family 2 protein [Rhizobium sp. BK602]MBB3612668.1 cellulose synthase/poly-beta-1,6-N-acetylglucosamine synthase-like glycosyltransferase [Rhizobium sp. BK602]